MLISAIRKFFSELSNALILSGNPDQGASATSFHRKNIPLLSFIGSFLTILFIIMGIFAFYNNHYSLGILNLSSAFFMLLFVLYLKLSKNYALTIRIIVIFCLIFTSYLFHTDIYGSGLFLWTLTAPMFLIFFLKLKAGTILAVIFYIVNITISLSGLFKTEYTINFIVRFSAVYMTLIIMSYIYGRIQEESYKKLLSLNENLNKTVKKLSLTKKNLEKSEERYRALVENNTDGIGILKDLHFVYINNKLCEMSGYQKDELIGKSLSNIIKSPNKEMFKRLFETETWSGLPRSRVELHLKKRSGELIEIEIGTNTVKHDESHSQLIFIRDVSERNLIEQERSKISKLESFRMVANGVTHDFNNILTIILGNLELIKFNASENKKLEKPVNKIEEASGRASRLLEDLYIFSTSSVKEDSLEDIQEIFESLLAPLRQEMPNIKFNLDFSDDLWKLRCDRKKTQIAIKNIVLNSVDATDGKGKINILVRNYLNQGRSIQPLRDLSYIKISIRDFGKGIPVENLGKVFDPYYSTKGNVTEKGIGLGLAIANKIVLDHLGFITVDSGEGEGTTFNVYFPAEIQS